MASRGRCGVSDCRKVGIFLAVIALVVLRGLIAIEIRMARVSIIYLCTGHVICTVVAQSTWSERERARRA